MKYIEAVWDLCFIFFTDALHDSVFFWLLLLFYIFCVILILADLIRSI